MLDDLAGMERGQRHFGRPRQPDIVVRQLVRFFPVAGELALVEEGLFAGDRRHGDRREAGPGDAASAQFISAPSSSASRPFRQ